MSVLQKFESLTLDPSEMISAVDREFIVKTEQEYELLMSNLTQWKAVLEENATKIPGTDFYQMLDESSNYRVEKDFMNSKSTPWYKFNMFTPAYGLSYLNSTIDFARVRLNHEIIEYFQEKYRLTFTVHNAIVCELETTDRVLEYILHAIGGTSFTDAAHQQILKAIQGDFKDGVLSGNKISFPNVWLPEDGCNFHSNGISHRLKSFICGLSYFESGQMEPPESLKEFFSSNRVSIKSEYAGEKFTGLKHFKNGKCELYFADSAAAADFYAMFKLEESKRDRR